MNLYDPNYPWKNNIDYRKNPHLYKIGKGEQGVLIVQPYKDEILPYWKFKTISEAINSSNKIYNMFLNYIKKNDFIGADMARKYLQMGMTRAARYKFHKSGRKYDPKTGKTLPYEIDKEKGKCSDIFKVKWLEARDNNMYKEMKKKHIELYG